MVKTYIANKLKINKLLMQKLATSKASVDINNISTTLEPEIKDYTKCKTSCPFYEIRDNSSHCQNDCTFILSTSTYSKSYNNKYALTDSQIKQLLYYYSIVFENKGITAPVTIAEVAATINVSKKTVYNNLIVLEKAKVIAVNKYKDNTHRVFILEYPRYNEEAKRKEPYMYISKNCFKKIMKIKDINALRLALILLVKLDNMKAVKKNAKSISFSYLKNILPSYIHTKNQIRDLLKSLDGIFSVFKDNDRADEFEYGYTAGVTYNADKNNDKFEAYFNKKLKAKGVNISPLTMRNLMQLRDQYGFKIVNKACELAEDKIIEILKEDDNRYSKVTAYIRRVIQNQFRSLVLEVI